MRPSIVQLRHIVFKGIHLEPVGPTDSAVSNEAANWDFEGVVFRVTMGVEELGPAADGTDSRAFVVTLGIAIDNAEGKPSPYLLDIAALGLIEVNEQIEGEKRADLAAVNGASLIYGAIRELVTTLTARSIAGLFVLPTMDFRDHLAIQTDTGESK
jgi:preprotein translocase subunit SecB